MSISNASPRSIIIAPVTFILLLLLLLLLLSCAPSAPTETIPGTPNPQSTEEMSVGAG